jgi:hypothetical protein
MHLSMTGSPVELNAFPFLNLIFGFASRQPIIMKNKSMDHKFDRIFTSVGLGLEKPQKTAFQAVLQASGVSDPSNALHVGDHEEKDYDGAVVRLSPRILSCKARLLPLSQQIADRTFDVQNVDECEF